METILALIVGLPMLAGFTLTCIKLYESKTVQDEIRSRTQAERKYGIHEGQYHVIY